jgi:hypothetical protein
VQQSQLFELCTSVVAGQAATQAPAQMSGKPAEQTHFPASLQLCLATAQVPHTLPQPSGPQDLPAQFGVQPPPPDDGTSAACVALCFLAFLTHFFFFLPLSFLHLRRALWAPASS